MNPGGTIALAEQDLLRRSVESCLDLPAKHFVEVGVWHAETSAAILSELEDNPGCHFTGVECNPEVRAFWARNTRGWETPRELLVMTSVQALKRIPGPLSWVFIDACHCYECALHDINHWSARVCSGGHVLVHDTRQKLGNSATKKSQHKKTRPFGVREAVPHSVLAKDGYELIGLNEFCGPGLRVYRKK